ncbi:MAG: hypothetical protein KA118_20290 [Verrucomicrobia bacterium]|nr:hypothetical protein [Verrucomicrobiota bacterium]
MFDETDQSGLSTTERGWTDTLRDAYRRQGHLTDKQYEVVRDIHRRHSGGAGGSGGGWRGGSGGTGRRGSGTRRRG